VSHGSQGLDPRPRVAALTACISALHQLFGEPQCIIDIANRVGRPANQSISGRVDVVVCTSRDCHLLENLPLPHGLFEHRPTDAEPMMLGFECPAVLRDRIGAYDYYGYLEDDLVLHDPWFFHKLAWFNRNVGDESLLQPNRYEVSQSGPVRRAYVDGDLHEGATEPFQNIHEFPELSSTVLGVPIGFRRPLNPHSGCYFLNDRQMRLWARRPDFLDRDTRFVGPLESAATLGVMRHFRVYKPARANAGFLEVRHLDNRYLGARLSKQPARATPA